MNTLIVNAVMAFVDGVTPNQTTVLGTSEDSAAPAMPEPKAVILDSGPDDTTERDITREADAIAGVHPNIQRGFGTGEGEAGSLPKPFEAVTPAFPTNEQPAIDWEAVTRQEFSKNVLQQAVQNLRGWTKWTWEQRYTRLCELREMQAGA